MPTRSECIFRMRDLLDHSWPSAPSFHQLLRQQISEEVDIVNSLNNTGQPWTTAEYQLNYSPGLGSYDINATDFGKVLYVVRLTQNQYIPALPVPFTDMSALQYGTLWNSFYNLYGSGAYVLPETIEQMAFYRTGATNQQCKVQIQPAPQDTCTYVVTYLVGYFGSDDPLNATAALPEFATLTQLRGAMALLPYTRWSDDRAADRERKQELALAFQYQLDRKERDFKDYKRSLVHSRTVDVGDWNAFA